MGLFSIFTRPVRVRFHRKSWSKKLAAIRSIEESELETLYGQIQALEEFFEKYLQQTIENYLTYKRSVDEQFRKWLDMGADLSGVAQKTMTGLTPFQSFFDPFSSSKPKQEKNRTGG